MITVVGYAGLQKVFPESKEEEDDFRRAVYVRGDGDIVGLSQHPMFPDYSDHFSSGIYRVNGQILPKSLGSQATYSLFKATLAASFLKKSTTTEVFENPEPGPFLELVYFDELGKNLMIGSKTCEKLLEDFKAHQNEAEALGTSFYGVYASLFQVVTVGVNSGCIAFTGP